jgi:alkylhydroperoxidase family enzyme
MPDIRQVHKALVRRILAGPGMAEPIKRGAAFNNSGFAGAVGALVDKVARHAFRVTDEDVTDARESGLSEDEVFEIVVCAAVGQATRQYDTALAALEAATGKK